MGRLWPQARAKYTLSLRVNDYHLAMIRSLAEQQDTTQNRLLQRVLIPAIEAQALHWWPARTSDRAWGGANQVAPLYSRYYEWRLLQGMFGDWVLIRVWGRNGTVLGPILRAWCPYLDSGAIRHAEAIQRRVRRGYSRGGGRA